MYFCVSASVCLFVCVFVSVWVCVYANMPAQFYAQTQPRPLLNSAQALLKLRSATQIPAFIRNQQRWCVCDNENNHIKEY